MAEPMMKGAVLRDFLEWYEKNHGPERLRAVAECLPEDLRHELDPDEPTVKLLASSWYPARLSYLLLDALTEGMSEAQVARLARNVARAVVERSTNGIYRFVLRRLVTPELYALKVARLWRQLHSTGDREMKFTSPTSVESAVRRWPGHHPVLCTITIETMCAVFESMGCKHVTWKRTSCTADGAKECVTLVEWA